MINVIVPIAPLAMEVLTAAAAEHPPPQNVYAIRFFCGLCIFLRHPGPAGLDPGKQIPAYQRFMGTADHNPLALINRHLLMPEAGEILNDNTADFALLHHPEQLLDCRTLEAGAAVPIVNELQNLHPCGPIPSVNILMERALLVLNAHTAHLAVLRRKPDVQADRTTHLPAPPWPAQSRCQR